MAAEPAIDPVVCRRGDAALARTEGEGCSAGRRRAIRIVALGSMVSAVVAAERKGVNLGRVDLNLLVALEALLDEANVTRAAERVHLSQPAMSDALQRLRRLFGDELLVRVGRQYQ